MIVDPGAPSALSLVAAGSPGVGEDGELGPIDLQVPAGGLIWVLGGAGAGVTTLLHLAVGRLRPSTGQVVLRDPSTLLLSRDALPGPLVHGRELPRRLGADEVRFRVVVEGFGVTSWLHLPLGQAPPNIRHRLLLAAALTAPHRVLGLEDPLGCLDVDAYPSFAREIQARCREGAAVIVGVPFPPPESLGAEAILRLDGGKIRDRLARGALEAGADPGAWSRGETEAPSEAEGPAAAGG